MFTRLIYLYKIMFNGRYIVCKSTNTDLVGSARAKFSFLHFLIIFHSLGLNGTGCSPRWQRLASLLLLGSPSVELALIGVLGITLAGPIIATCITLAGPIIATCMLFRRASLIRSYHLNNEKHILHIHPGLSDCSVPTAAKR